MEDKGSEDKVSAMMKNRTETIRCHQCGTSKGDEDVGIWVAFKSKEGPTSNIEYMVWFQSEECQKIWLANYAEKIELVG